MAMKHHKSIILAKPERYNNGATVESHEFLCTPHDLEAWHTRRTRRTFPPSCPQAAVDIFVWRREVPEHPWLTRVGGLPFRDPAKPWPVHKGTLMSFVAQICFLDSRDLFTFHVPDVLLIWCNEPPVYGNPPFMGFGSKILTEWVWLEEVSPECPIQNPNPDETISSRVATGQICRSIEFQLSGREHERLFGSLKAGKAAKCWGTKIGGIAPASVAEGRTFLCTLSSIMPCMHLADNPDTWGMPLSREFQLCIGDMDCFAFYVDSDLNVTHEYLRWE